MYYQSIQWVQRPEAFSTLPEAVHKHRIYRLWVICAHQCIFKLLCVFFCLFLAFCNLSAWARFCESFWDTILQFLRALLLMACNKPHRIFPLVGGEVVNCHKYYHLHDLELGELLFRFLTPANHRFFCFENNELNVNQRKEAQ